MKILKWILIILVIVIAIPLITALFVKKDFVVSREVTINKPRTEVFNYVKHLKNQDNFSAWNKKDPNMKKSYRGGEDGTVGFIAAWESDTMGVGKGEQEIKKIDEGKSVDTELRFEKPFKNTGQASFTTEDAGSDQTKVKWTFSGQFPWPFNLMGLIKDMDQELGKDLQTGLDNLKTELEKTPTVTTVTTEPTTEPVPTTTTTPTTK